MVDLHIIEEIEEKLLHRKKLVVVGNFDGPVPSRGGVLLELAKKLNASPEVLVLRSIRTHFGERKFTTVAFLYESPEYAKRIELKHYLTRTKLPQPEQQGSGSEQQENQEATAPQESAQ